MSSSSITRVAVIMAGGSGERFWPVSRRDHPKQLLRLTSAEQTMLHEAVQRISPIVPPQHIYVQTMDHLVHPIRKAEVGIPPENVIAEPCKRNTAGCLVYATAHLLAKYKLPPEQISVAVLTADHVIEDPELFRRTVVAALEAGEASDALLTMGVRPTRPATGYGYIQTERVPASLEAAEVRGFHEKPDVERATHYVADGNYFWNSGMFFWRLSSFCQELEQAQPAMHAITHELSAALGDHDQPLAREIFERLDNISIDYALMEKARHVQMIPADFPWDDVGTWSALERTRQADAAGNVVEGSAVVIDSNNCIVYNAEESGKMAVAIVGADNLVVVVTKDAVLVVPKDRTEEVKKAVQELEKRKAEQL